ncbi:hypothetical protein [Spiroplasma endosymbiont of Asaphidion curtum]|uniref:hypothetical protein n=1 Tax=Spiroplasma endosymbiont of Asaphidion curtum TaxID=3066281 RepID=UPI00313EA65F
MYSTSKSFFNTLLGIIGTFLGSVFQFVLIYLIIKYYGAKMNGLVRTIMAISFTIGLAESSLGIMGIFYLYHPLAKKDWITVNDIVGTIKNNYIKTGIIYLSLVIFLGLGFSLYAYWNNVSETITDDVIQVMPFWQLWIIIISLSLKNLISFFIVGAYENLIQADNGNYFNRIVHLTCDLLVFTGVILWMWISARNGNPNAYLPFLVYICHGIIKSILIYIYVKLKYPWLQTKEWTKNDKLLQESNYVAVKSYAVALFNNIDYVLIALFIGFRTASGYSIYMTVAINMRVIMLLFITSFKDFFGTWISYQGRISWNTFVKFELFAYMVAAFMFVVQFIMSPYFVNGLYGELKVQMLATVRSSNNPEFENIAIKTIFDTPHLSLIFAINSALLMISEPASILIYGAGRHRETTKHAYMQVVISLVISLILGSVFTYYLKDAQLTIYALVLSTTFGLFYRWIYSSSYTWKYLTYNSNARFWWKNLAIIIIPMIFSIVIAYKLIFSNAYYQFANYEQLSSQLGIKGIIKLFMLILVISVPGIILLAAITEPLQLMAILSRSSLTNWIIVRLKKQLKNKDDFYTKDELIAFDDPDKIKVHSIEAEDKWKYNQRINSKNEQQAVYTLTGKN